MTAFRMFDLLDAVDKRETYLALMVEHPEVLNRIARIAYQSAWAADFFAVHGADPGGGGGAVAAVGDPLVWVQDVAHECFYLGRWGGWTTGAVLQAIDMAGDSGVVGVGTYLFR